MPMEKGEHLYSEDPNRGPADGITTLAGVDYFWLGNGFLSAAVQINPSGKGTTLGLLILHPDKLGHKRTALTFDPETGLQDTMVTVQYGEKTYQPVYSDPKTPMVPGEFMALWTKRNGVPAVQINWPCGDLYVMETFYCPDRSTPCLLREIAVVTAGLKKGAATETIILATGGDDIRLEKTVPLNHYPSVKTVLSYRIEAGAGEPEVMTSWMDLPPPKPAASDWWQSLADIEMMTPLSHLFRSARDQLPAVIRHNGMVDGSIWQYNLEWVRDQVMHIQGLCLIGAFDIARTMLTRILSEFVTDAGDTVDSSRHREPPEVELDQNGLLLTALKTYTDWSGDLSLVRTNWKKIRAVAEFPLQEVFRHPESGLLYNRREFWERYSLYGIEFGMEITYQLYVSHGLSCISSLAERLGHASDAERWREEAARLKAAMLGDSRYGLVEDGRLIKRRRGDGTVQETITVAPDSDLPTGTPLDGPGPHYLNPDTSVALPVALEFIDPGGDLAKASLASLEVLWNQAWDYGGYCRYNVTSEADSPGPWPFATMFVARAALEAGEYEKVQRILDWFLTLPSGTKAGSWFEFYGPKQVPPCPPVGIIPWTWAEVILFFIHHLFGIRPEQDRLIIRPRLLPDMSEISARVRIGDHWLILAVRTQGVGKAFVCGDTPGAIVDGEPFEMNGDSVMLPPPDQDRTVTIVLPNRF
jgi:hypothetical protein